MQICPSDQDVNNIINGTHPDSFSYLGMHRAAREGGPEVRAFLPHADTVEVIDAVARKPVADLQKARLAGNFVGLRVRKESRRGHPYSLRLDVSPLRGGVYRRSS